MSLTLLSIGISPSQMVRIHLMHWTPIIILSAWMSITLIIPPAPNLPTLHQTDWNQYKQLLNSLIDPWIPLNTNAEIEQATKTITAVICSAYEYCTFSTTKAAQPSPDDLQTQLFIKLKRCARKQWETRRRPVFKSLYNRLNKLVRNRLTRIQIRN